MSVAAAPPLARLGVRVERVPGMPIAALRVSFAGGARAEALPGQALVAARSLAEGTRRRGHAELAERLEARGILFHAGGGFESHGVSLDALAGDWEEALELAAEIVFEPSFFFVSEVAEERCRWVARQTAAELDSLADQPAVKTAWAFLDQLYRPHRRALPLQGTREALAGLTAADCAAFHHRALAAGADGRGAVVTVAGDVDAAAVEAAVAAGFGERFERLAGEAVGPAEPFPGSPAPAGGAARVEVELPPPEPGEAPQGHLYLGHPTVDRRHPDFDALSLAAIVLGAGSGLTGRIPERIREREGLAYTASADLVAGAGLDPGRLVVYVGTSPDTLEQAERSAREELARFADQGLSEAEFADARAYLVGRAPFRRETARQIADLMVRAEHLRLPLDRPGWREERLAALTRDQVAAAVRRHVKPEELKVTLGVPA